jgi:hypothetical protein
VLATGNGESWDLPGGQENVIRSRRKDYLQNGIVKSFTGKIIGIARNSINVITSLTVALYSGFIVQFKPHNMSWFKI